MTNLTENSIPLGVHSIFHPSDFSKASEVAFAHALRIALMAKSRLTVMHVSQGEETHWEDFPGVREMLERWGLIPAGSPRRAVAELGIEVAKVACDASNPVHGCLGFLEQHPCDLIVLAVKTHEGRMRWFHRSIGEPIAQGAGEMTLFLPHGVPGFVSLENGSVNLKNILIPVAPKPSPEPSIRAVDRLLQHLGLEGGKVQLLHVGPEEQKPPLEIPPESGWKWGMMNMGGDPVQVILQTAKEMAADLIVMTTDGPDRFLDGLRGTTSERVLRGANCPILNIPAGSLFG